MHRGTHPDDGQIPLALGDEAFARPVAAPQQASPNGRPRRPSGFAGYSWGQIAAALALIALAAWNLALAREIQSLRERRLVAVRLSDLVNDFVVAEARSGRPSERVEQETRQFMARLGSTLEGHAARGETIIVGEAVLAGSVPDITAQVRAELGQPGRVRRPDHRKADLPAGQPSDAAPEEGLDDAAQ